MLGSPEVEECAGRVPLIAEAAMLKESRSEYHAISHLAPRTIPALIDLIVGLNLSDKQVPPPQRHLQLDEPTRVYKVRLNSSLSVSSRTFWI